MTKTSKKQLVDKILSDTYLKVIWFSVLGAVLPFFFFFLLNIQEEACNCQEIPIKPFHQLSPLEVFCVSALFALQFCSVCYGYK